MILEVDISFLKDYSVTFPLRLATSRGTPYTLSLESLYTEYGFVVPCDLRALGVATYLKNGSLLQRKPSVVMSDMSRAMVVTSDELIYDVCLIGKTSHLTYDILPGPGAFYPLCGTAHVDEAVYAASRVRKSPKGILEIVDRTNPICISAYTTMQLKNIAKELTARGYTKPLSDALPKEEKSSNT